MAVMGDMAWRDVMADGAGQAIQAGAISLGQL